jgi:hypothetical protein
MLLPLLLVCWVTPALALPAVFSLDPARLVAARAAVRAGAPSLQPATHALLVAATSWLAKPIPLVTNTTLLPPSGDPRDYQSAATYYWPCNSNPCGATAPNCSKAGLPWVDCDGHANMAAIAAMDFPRLENAVAMATTLSFAFFFSGEPAFGAKAAAVFRAWFSRSAPSGMHPCLPFAQQVPGRSNVGHGIGIIDTSRSMALLLDAAVLLGTDAASGWTPADAAELSAWSASLLAWLTSSPNGAAERRMANNHGTWFDAQAQALALHTGNRTLAAAFAAGEAVARLDAQIAANGSLPLECARADSLLYVSFDIAGLQTLAQLSSASEEDLWAHTTPEGATLASTLAFLVPYALHGAPWPFPLSAPFDWGTLRTPFLRAALATGNATFAQWAAALPGNHSADLDNLLWCLACPSETPFHGVPR